MNNLWIELSWNSFAFFVKANTIQTGKTWKPASTSLPDQKNIDAKMGCQNEIITVRSLTTEKITEDSQ